MAAPRTFAVPLLTAASANLASAWLDVSGCGMLTMTVRAQPSAATLVGVLTFQATSNAVEDPTEPLLTNGVLISPTITGITFAAATASVTYASPAAAIDTIVIAFPTFPQKVRANWAFTSGGGTVSLIVTAAGWTV